MMNNKQSTQPLKLKHILVFPFIILISLAVVITSYLTWKYSEESTLKLGDRINEQSASFIEKKLDYYFDIADTSNQSLKNVITYGLLNAEKQGEVLGYITHIVNNNSNISTLSFAYPDGSYLGISNTPNGDLLKKIASPATDRVFYTYNMSNNDILQQRDNYDARVRPWFKEAKTLNTPVWSSVFKMFSNGKLGVTLSEALYKDNLFLGVIGTDVVFHDLDEQLNKMRLTDNAYLFILDQDNKIIAHSNDNKYVEDLDEKKSLLITVTESDNDLIKKSLAYINQNNTTDSNEFHGESELTLGDKKEDYFINYIPYSHGNGMKWNIGVVIPKSDFLGDIKQMRKNTFNFWIVSFLLSIIVGLMITYLINRTIKDLQTKVNKVESDGDIYEHDYHNIKEVNDLSIAFLHMSKRLQKSDLDSNTDSLTKLPNRRAFDQFLKLYWKNKQTNTLSNVVLIIFDLDFFKQYNDTYGHPMGDTCLRTFSTLIKMYTPKTGLSARIGGEEFAIILQDTDIDAALVIVTSIMHLLASKKIIHENSPISEYVTTSIGISCSENSCATSRIELIKQADDALYKAKRNGKNCYIVYS